MGVRISLIKLIFYQRVDMFNGVEVWWMGSNFHEGNSLPAKLSPK